MKRLVLILPSFAGGGAERVSLMLATRLNRETNAVEIGVLDCTGPLASLVPDDVAITDLAAPRLRSALRPLAAWLRRRRPHVVLSTFGYVNLGLLALRPLLAADTRLVIREANTPSLSLAQGRAPMLTGLGYRLLYPTADLVLCQHALMASEMERRFNVAENRIALLPNPVDTDALRPHAPRREPGPGRRFVAAGRLTRQKGFDRLITAFAASDPEDRLTIFGDGPDRAVLERAIDNLGLDIRVRLAGYEAEPWPWYAGADAVLVSSRWEGLPNVALEALACGTPVIATPQSGGIAEVASQAPDGAVVVASWGRDFTDAMAAVTPCQVENVRPSLLPARYELASVVNQFEALLAAL